MFDTQFIIMSNCFQDYYLKTREIASALKYRDINMVKGFWNPHFAACLNITHAKARITYSKLVVELVREERIGQLSEVELAQWANTVNILHVHIFRQVRNIFTIKLMPDWDEMQENNICHGHAYKENINYP